MSGPDHHAIIPTTISPEKTGLSAEESKIYDLAAEVGEKE